MPAGDRQQSDIESLIPNLIHTKIRRLIGKAGFHGQDRLDLEQEVWTKLWPRLRTYDTNKGQPQGFLGTVIDRLLINLLRDRFAAKRDFRRVGSLHQRVCTDEGQMELGQSISQEEQDVRQGRTGRREVERMELALDVAVTIARLPEDNQELVRLLQHHSVAEIARQQGVPRSTLQARIRQLRQLFDDAGLRAYL